MTWCCPRCGGELRPPGLMQSEWRCERCGPVLPMHRAHRNSPEVLAAARDRVAATEGRVPLWCPWPLLPGWSVAGVAWAGDDRTGPRATALAVGVPAPLGDGPAELVFVAEEPGVGLGTGLAGHPGADPGEAIHPGADAAQPAAEAPPVRLRASGHPAPLWEIPTPPDRAAFAGEARGVWLMVIAWPASAGYALAESISLRDLAEEMPAQLVFGAPSRQLSVMPAEE